MCDYSSLKSGSYEGINVGVLTSGGDSQGMNAAIRAAARMGIYLGCKVFFIHEGYEGLMTGGDKIVEATWSSVARISDLGGTVIGSARCMEFYQVKGRIAAAKTLIDHDISRLVIIGGDGSLTGADTFKREWDQILDSLVCSRKITREQAQKHPKLYIAGIVGSIDNDFCDTDMTIGTDSALFRITESVNTLQSTAYSHQRTFIIEVMGRRCGYLGLCGGIAANADYAFYPENPPNKDWPEELCSKLVAMKNCGKRLHIIIVSEGAIDADGNPLLANDVCKVIQDRLHFEARVTVLGHLQRGGTPSAFDKLLGFRMGSEAVLAVLDGAIESCVITIDGRDTKRQPLMPIVMKTRSVQKAIEDKDFNAVQELRGRTFIQKIQTFETLSNLRPPTSDANLKLNGYHIAVIHIGSVASGFDTAVKICARYCMSHGATVYGIYDGIDGLREGNLKSFKWYDIVSWRGRGCTLGISRTKPEPYFDEISSVFREYKIDALIIIGGFAGFVSALQFFEARSKYKEFCIPIALIPGTVSNNVPGTDLCIGSDTALNEITRTCTGISLSAGGNDKRMFVVETMGANCGYLATISAITSCADSSYILEEKFSLHDLYQDVRHMRHKITQGDRTSLIICNERACKYYTSDFINRLLAKEGEGLFTTRMNKVGHIQQQLSPSPQDKKLATRFSFKVCEWIKDNITRFTPGQVNTNDDDTTLVIGLICGKYVLTPICTLKDQTDFVLQLPKEQWWLKLRELASILSKDPALFGRSFSK